MFTKIQTQLKSNKGFTLIELMVVISIIAILVAIALPRFAEARRSANTAKIAADLRSIDSAITMYEADTGKAPAKNAKIDGSVLYPSTGTKYFASAPKPPNGPINYSAIAGGVAVQKDIKDLEYQIDTVDSATRGMIAVDGAQTYECFVGFKPKS